MEGGQVLIIIQAVFLLAVTQDALAVIMSCTNSLRGRTDIPMAYDDDTHICCRGVIEVRSKSPAQDCCGHVHIYWPDIQECCRVNGEYVVLNKTGSQGCCRQEASGEGTLFNKETEVCCGGRTHKKINGHECCGQETYNPDEHYCCNNNRKVEQTSDTVYDSEKGTCCNRAHRGSDKCCGDRSYNSNTHKCCSDLKGKSHTVSNKDDRCTDHSGENTKLCHITVINHSYGSTSLRNITVRYNPLQEVCLNIDGIHELMSLAPGHLLCSQSKKTQYNPQTQMCIAEEVVNLPLLHRPLY